MKLAIAAGGTGGHLFPGIALAQALKERDSMGEVSFIGSDRGIEREILERAGLIHETLTVGRIKGEGLAGRMKTILQLPRAFWAAWGILRKIMPAMVFGIGGYSSGPVVLAAFFRRIPRAILEPNAIPGFTNRILSRFVNRIFIAFPETMRFFPIKKVRLTGTPVRRELTAVGSTRRIFLKKTPFTIVILGGSQGATPINRALVALLPFLEKSGRSLRIFHQTGAKDADWVEEAYGRTSIPHEVSAFMEDMVSVYREADLAICRAGASTVAELIETRTPSILIPYPFAADDHQRVNALSVVQEGGAEMVPEKAAPMLGQKILHYEGHREELEKMRENLAAMRKTPAAGVIAEECLAMVERVSND